MEDNIMFVATLQYLQQPPLTLIVEEGYLPYPSLPNYCFKQLQLNLDRGGA